LCTCFGKEKPTGVADEMTETKAKYYIVESTAVPEVLLKVVEAKRFISLEGCSINDAVKQVGLSRSAFYKYRDRVSEFIEASNDKIVTLQANLNDEAGVLSQFLNMFADFKVNILTINQTIPVNGQAALTISIRTGGMAGDIEQLIKRAETLRGVLKVGILASAV